MAGVGQWNMVSTHPLMNRKVLTMICCFFMRGSEWRSAVCTARAAAPWGVYHMSAPSWAGTKLLGVRSPSAVSATVPNPDPLESRTHLTQIVSPHLTSHSFWGRVHLTQPKDSPKLDVSAWALSFLWVLCHPLPLQVFLQSPQGLLQQRQVFIC